MTTEAQRRAAAQNIKMEYHHAGVSSLGQENAADARANSDDNVMTMPVRSVAKVGRNEACPCGSGKKFKQCHGSLS